MDLRREHFDLVVDMRADDRGAIMSYITGAPIRVSQFYAHVPFWRNKLFTHLFNSPGKKVRGAAEQSLRIVRELGIDTVDITPRLCTSEMSMLRAREILFSQGVSDTTRFISLNPFSRWAYKEWDYEKWMEIINWLWNKYNIATVIVGTDEEHTRADALLRKCSGSVFNLAGKTMLGELAGILHLSSLHIGVDSAAPHIAAAVGTPTITIYGPSDWYDWAPMGDVHKVILPDLACVPCHKKGCDDMGWSRCLEELTVDQVKKVLQEFLEGTFHSSVGLRKVSLYK
jgi:ADP-heptose:LPS heptosyltransferase